MSVRRRWQLVLGLPLLVAAGGVPTPGYPTEGMRRLEIDSHLAEGGSSLMVLGGLIRTYSVQPGDVVQGEILIRNTLPEAQVVRVYLTDYRRTETGALVFPDAGALPRSNAFWIEAFPEEQVIPGGATVPVTFVIRIPSDLTDMGTYWSMIMVQGFPLAERLPAAEVGLITVREAFRTAVRVVTNVAKEGVPVEPSLRFTERALVIGEAGPELRLTIENDGPLMLRLALWAELVDTSGYRAGRFAASDLSLLPGEVGVRRIDLAQLSPGRYEALVVADSRGEDVFGARYLIDIPEPTTSSWGRDIRIQSLQDSLIRAESGEVITLSFHVENLSRSPHTMTESLDLPLGWRVVLSSSSFTLDVGGRALRLVAVMPGAHALGGLHDLRYQVVSQEDSRIHGGVRIQAELDEIHALELIAPDSNPRTILAGESANLGLRVLNRGNVPLDVQLSASAKPGGTVDLMPPSLVLAPGELASVQMHLVTDGLMMGERSLPVTVTASTPPDRGKCLVEARERFQIDVLPREIGGAGWLRYPLTLSTHRSADVAGSMNRFTVQGSGDLDVSGNRRLQFLFTTTDRDRPSFGAGHAGRSHAAATLQFPWGRVMVGDQAFRLSELVGPVRGGRGGGLALEPSVFPVQLSGFRVSNTVGGNRRTDMGGFLALGSWPDFSRSAAKKGQGLRVNFLQSEGMPLGGHHRARDGILTFEGQMTTGLGLRLEGEYAQRRSAFNPGWTGQSWRMVAQGRWSASGSYRVRGIRNASLPPNTSLSPRLHGSTYEGHLNLPVSSRVRASFAARHASRSWVLHDGSLTGVREIRYRGRLRQQLWGRAQGSLEYNRSVRSDLLSSPARRVDQHQVGTVLSQTLGPVTYRGELQGREILNSDAMRWGYGYHLSVTYRPSRTFSLRAQTRQVAQGRGREDVGTIQWQPYDPLRLRAHYAKTDVGLAIRDGGRLIQGGLEVVLATHRDQEIRAEVRRLAIPFGADQTWFQISYQRRVDLPIARQRGWGKLEGVAHVVGPEGSVPLVGAVVRVAGVAQRTDGKGRFYFQALPEGRHSLVVDSPTLVLGAGVIQNPPVIVDIRGEGPPQRIELNLYRGASLRGIVEFVDPARYPGFTPPLSLAGFRVVLSLGEDVRHTWTDAQGDFLFQRLPPGIWTLRIDSAGLPSQFRPETEGLEVPLTPGTEHTVTLRLVPVERRLRLIDEGEIIGPARVPIPPIP